MTALTDEKLNMVVGGLEIGADDNDLPEWWRKFKVCIVILCDENEGMSKQAILDDVKHIFGPHSWEVEYAKKKLHMK